MFAYSALLAFTYAATAFAQQVGTLTAETHPSLPWQKCTAAGCTAQAGKIVLDSNWRWLHSTSGSTNCYTGNTWNSALCPDGATCAANCALDGADYSGVYGITTSGNALTLKFVTQGANKNVGSRVYMLSSTSESQYEMFKVLNQEFSFDVDVSNLPCGLNGALYFSQMDADGGLARFPTNKAGAKYGTGYCDSQCPRDIKFINGVANSDGWIPSPNDANAGTGPYGACCNEMDIWEANSISAAYTPHPCTTGSQTRCSGSTCQTTDRYGSICDPDGCDFNAYRMGNPSFYGPGKTVDTTKKFTVVTQFLTDSGTATGNLKEIRRLYVQNGQVIQNSKVNIPGMSSSYDSVTSQYCNDQKKVFGDTTSFQDKGGLAAMGAGLSAGMALVLSVWDDHNVNMLWLDSTYPTNSTAPGAARGSCSTDSGKPTVIEAQNANASVTYSNIKVGDIGTTYTGTGSSSSPGGGSTTTTSSTTTPASSSTTSKPATSTTSKTTTSTASTTSSAAGPAQTKYGQCGGQGYSGPTACVSGSTCTFSNPWYSQCL